MSDSSEMTVVADQPEPLQVFNVGLLIMRMEQDMVLAREVVHSAMAALPNYLSALQLAVEEGDVTQVRHYVHTLKGLVAQISGEIMADHLGELYARLKQGQVLNGDDWRQIQADYLGLQQAVSIWSE